MRGRRTCSESPLQTRHGHLAEPGTPKRSDDPPVGIRELPNVYIGYCGVLVGVRDGCEQAVLCRRVHDVRHDLQLVGLRADTGVTAVHSRREVDEEARDMQEGVDEDGVGNEGRGGCRLYCGESNHSVGGGLDRVQCDGLDGAVELRVVDDIGEKKVVDCAGAESLRPKVLLPGQEELHLPF